MRLSVKEHIVEFLKLMEEAHQEIHQKCLSGNRESAVQLLEQCQEGAIHIGTLVEEAEGEGFVTVTLLEEYCELIYRMHEEVLQTDIDRIPAVFESLEGQLSRILNSVNRDIEVRREVVFLPFLASAWDTLESVWRAACEEPGCEVSVIPVPYYDKRPDGSFGERHHELYLYPEDVPVLDYRRYDFEKHHPDVIVMQNPYDEFHYTISVEPFFYSRNLKQYTDKLVYIPYFAPDEIGVGDERAWQNMRYYVTMPGVVYADEVIVQSEQMRLRYIEFLTEAAGEHTREIWENKILGTGSPLCDSKTIKTKERIAVPDAWKTLMIGEEGSYKKILLYYTCVSTLLENGDRMIQKMKQIFSLFREHRKEIVPLWRPDPHIAQTLSELNPGLWQAYCDLVKTYREEEVGIYDDTDDVDRAVALSDAYYGDPGSMIRLCSRAGLPVMIADYQAEKR